MSFLLKLLPIFFLLGCGEAERITDPISDLFEIHHDDQAPPMGPFQIDPELKPFYDDFLADAARRSAPLSDRLQDIEFTDSFDNIPNAPTPPNGTYIIGLCYYDSYTDSDIRHVRILSLERHSPILETLLYHELGHCLLGLGHTPPNSNEIMEPVLMMTMDYIQSHWISLVNYEFDSEIR